MPGGQRINNISVRMWSPKVDVSACSLEIGPCNRPDVKVSCIKEGEYYLEQFDDEHNLTIYVFLNVMTELFKLVEAKAEQKAKAHIRNSMKKLLDA